MSKFDSCAGGTLFGNTFAGSLPVDNRRFTQVSISTGGTFTSADSLGFFTGRREPERYKITGVVINFKKTEDDRS